MLIRLSCGERSSCSISARARGSMAIIGLRAGSATGACSGRGMSGRRGHCRGGAGAIRAGARRARGGAGSGAGAGANGAGANGAGAGNGARAGTSAAGARAGKNGAGSILCESDVGFKSAPVAFESGCDASRVISEECGEGFLGVLG